MQIGQYGRDGKCDTLAAIIPVKIFPFLRGISLKLVKNGLKMKKTRQNQLFLPPKLKFTGFIPASQPLAFRHFFHPWLKGQLLADFGPVMLEFMWAMVEFQHMTVEKAIAELNLGQ